MKRSQIEGTYRELAEVQARLKWASRHAHLVSPTTTAVEILDGCAVQFSVVTLDVERDTYPADEQPGMHGVKKRATQKLARAAGVSWDYRASGRQDNERHPHVCQWRAAGFVLGFDGRPLDISGDCEKNLRDGSEQIVGVSRERLHSLRRSIQSLAETGAQLRAIRTLGIDVYYPEEELRRPFVVARAVFDGQAADADLRRRYAERALAAQQTARSLLYGS